MVQPPRALLLDAMGTLIGLHRSAGQTYASAAAGFGIAVEAAAIDRHFPALLRQAPPLAFPGLGGADLRQAEVRWWGARIDAVLQACGAAAAPEELHRSLFDQFADPGLWRVYPDVLPQLQRWRRRGLALAVVSNFDSRLHGLLEGLALSPLLDAVLISSEAGAAKPDPALFQLALERLGCGPADAWHVGDSPEDGEGAHRAGIRWLRIRRR